MDISQWWRLIRPDTRAWLIAHNGEALAPPIIDDILAVTGGTTDSQWWGGEAQGGPLLTDEATDWIEAVANDEQPA
ncbi:hypothetical protein [Sinomonas sp.]|jgi:hypothetical protein|uniref:hypothetical protein n=1 Tax=Sinomonas sp. TaxID=1914986 RepID=UPI002FE042CB